MDKLAGSQNNEFYTPAYAVAPLLKYIDKGKRVWCPFDDERSLIVKCLREHGNEVEATHISQGFNFFTTWGRQCDLIVSNPPFARKTEVFNRLFNIGKPFAMLVGAVGLFESEKRFGLFKGNPFEIMYLSRRVAFLSCLTEKTPTLHPPFSSVWLTSQILPERIVFEEI